MRTNALQKQTKYMTHTHMTKPNQMHANTSQFLPPKCETLTEIDQEDVEYVTNV